jgi:hypothetical protein
MKKIKETGYPGETAPSIDSPFHSYHQNFKSVLLAKPPAFSGLVY